MKIIQCNITKPYHFQNTIIFTLCMVQKPLKTLKTIRLHWTMFCMLAVWCTPDTNNDKNGCDAIIWIKLFTFYCRYAMTLMCVDSGFIPSNNQFNLWSCQSVESHSQCFMWLHKSVHVRLRVALCTVVWMFLLIACLGSPSQPVAITQVRQQQLD